MIAEDVSEYMYYVFNYIFSSEVKDFRHLLNASKVWDLKEDERIQLVYVFQSSHRAKASTEFLAVSEEYLQVIAKVAHCLWTY